MRTRIAIVFLSLALFNGRAIAQITYDGCRDARGAPVASMLSSNLQDVAIAALGPDGRPVIYYNPDILASLRPATRLFFYGHECAHHRLGHILQGIPLGSEQQADCFSVRELTRAGLLSDADVTVVQQDIAAAGRGDWTHLPGPIRAINLRSCLAGGGQRTVACQHHLHQFDTVPCTHPAHPNGDLHQCTHICYWPNGSGPCHPSDVYPCRHPAHPNGDAIPCVHIAHPNGDVVPE